MLQILDRNASPMPPGRPMRKVGSGHGAATWRIAAAGLGAVLLLYAAARIALPWSAEQGELNEAGRVVALWSLDGPALSHDAEARARRLLAEPPAEASALRIANSDAQTALRAGLSVSPLSAEHWLLLALLNRQAGEPALAPLKLSFLTGKIPAGATATRLRAVATTAAADDEEIRLLAQADIRTMLSPTPAAQGDELRAIYREATPAGRAFLRAAVSAVDGRFAATLQ
ncbi:hypothetical protein NML43_04235 [Rhodopseudomonas palustris]|uniref:hypothetical protein n=1 Tax=Rhodopseudomonas palustris TaxID=1076 RepID=UPI0020CF3FB9|nr:hypothetical protein [Rhodopseudomonas palustris]MCP9626295.1 hypothetical protein [Rhodopseudomonas palustris]